MSQRGQFWTTSLIILGVLLTLVIDYLFFLKGNLDASSAVQYPYRFNAAIIRFRTFDSVIAGSCLSQNFKCTEFDEIAKGTSYKLAVSGCPVPDACLMLENAFRHHKIHSVLMDLYNAVLMMPLPEKGRSDILYFQQDAGVWCDIRDGVSLRSLQDRRKHYWNLLRKKKAAPRKLSRDEMHCWFSRYPWGKEHFACNVVRGIGNPVAEISRAALQENIDKFLMPLFRGHPQVTFYLFLPPLTPFEYIDREDLFLARKAVMDKFLSLPNVALFDFQGEAKICMDYDNFRDSVHYAPSVNSWILKQIKENKYRVTPENRKEFERRFSAMLNSFDNKKELAKLKKYHAEHPVK